MSDDNDPDTLGGAFRQALDSASRRARTWQPGRVESFNAATGRADVQPLIGRRVRGRDGQVTVEHDPVIPDVPVGFPGAGGVRLRFPVSKGDIVLLLFCERSLDKFKGGVRKKHDPGEVRTHNASDAIAIPGVIDTGGDAATAIEFTAAGQVNVGGELALALAAELADLKVRIAAWAGGGTSDAGASLKAVFAAWPAPGTIVTKGQ